MHFAFALLAAYAVAVLTAPIAAVPPVEPPLTIDETLVTKDMQPVVSPASMTRLSLSQHDQSLFPRYFHVFDIFRGVDDNDYLNMEDARILTAVSIWNTTTCIPWYFVPIGNRAWVSESGKRVLHQTTHSVLFVAAPGEPCRLRYHGFPSVLLYEVVVGECGTHALTQLLGRILGLMHVASYAQHLEAWRLPDDVKKLPPITPWDAHSVMQHANAYFSTVSQKPSDYEPHIGVRTGVSKGDVDAVHFLHNRCVVQSEVEEILCSSSHSIHRRHVVQEGVPVTIVFVGKVIGGDSSTPTMQRKITKVALMQESNTATIKGHYDYPRIRAREVKVSWVPNITEQAQQSIGITFYASSLRETPSGTEREDVLSHICKVDFKVVPLTCYGVNAAKKDLVCSGRGTCVTHNECKCDEGYQGRVCEYPVASCPSGNLLWAHEPTKHALRDAGLQMIFDASAPDRLALLVPLGQREVFQGPASIPYHVSMHLRALGRAAWHCRPTVSLVNPTAETCTSLTLTPQGWSLDGSPAASYAFLEDWSFLEFSYVGDRIAVYVNSLHLGDASPNASKCIRSHGGISAIHVSCIPTARSQKETAVPQDSAVLVSHVKLSCMNVLHLDGTTQRTIYAQDLKDRAATSNSPPPALHLRFLNADTYQWKGSGKKVHENLRVLSPKPRSKSPFLDAAHTLLSETLDSSSTLTGDGLRFTLQTSGSDSFESVPLVNELIWLVPVHDAVESRGVAEHDTRSIDITGLRLMVLGTCPYEYHWNDMRTWIRMSDAPTKTYKEDIVFVSAAACAHSDPNVITCTELRSRASYLYVRLMEANLQPMSFSFTFARSKEHAVAPPSSDSVSHLTVILSDAYGHHHSITLAMRSLEDGRLSWTLRSTIGKNLLSSSGTTQTGEFVEEEVSTGEDDASWNLLSLEFDTWEEEFTSVRCSIMGMDVIPKASTQLKSIARIQVSGDAIRIASVELLCPTEQPFVSIGSIGSVGASPGSSLKKLPSMVSDEAVQLFVHAGTQPLETARLSASSDEIPTHYYLLDKTHIGPSMYELLTRFRSSSNHAMRFDVVFDGSKDVVTPTTVALEAPAWYMRHIIAASRCTASYCQDRGTATWDAVREQCTCSCPSRFQGDRCEMCHEMYHGDDCNTCRLGGFYPNCTTCQEHCYAPERGRGVWSAAGKCVCFCTPPYHGEQCEFCSASAGGTCSNLCKHGYRLQGNKCVKCDADDVRCMRGGQASETSM